MKRKRITLATAVAAALLLASDALWPPGGAESLPLLVKFVGYGTDATGERTAAFTLTNGGDVLPLRETHCRVEYRDDEQLVPSFSVATTRALAPGESETVTIPAPTGRGTWRVGFKVQKQDFGFDAIDWANKYSLIPDAVRTRNHSARIKVSRSEWIAY